MGKYAGNSDKSSRGGRSSEHVIIQDMLYSIMNTMTYIKLNGDERRMVFRLVRMQDCRPIFL